MNPYDACTCGVRGILDFNCDGYALFCRDPMKSVYLCVNNFVGKSILVSR